MTQAKDYTVSYAQNREDVLLRAFFPDVKNGFYVDVGANHPSEDSVTKLFYDSGWNGINIEPNSGLYKLLLAERKRDINLNIGISNKKGSLVLREYVNHGLSTFSNVMKDDYEGSTNEKTASYKDVRVPVETLADVLKEHAKGREINFMKIDVEGYEYEVLEGNDWDNFRPEMICIESNHIVKDWRPILKEAKYKLVFNDGLNDYYLAQESSHREERFDYPEAILIDPPIVNPNIFDKIQRLEKATADLQKAAQAIEAQKKEIQSLQESRHELFMQLQRYSGIRAQLRALLVDTYVRVNRKIDNIGKFKVANEAPVFSGTTGISDEELKAAVANYDRTAFSEKRTIGNGIARMYSKALKTALHSFVRTLKVIFKAVKKAMKKVRA